MRWYHVFIKGVKEQIRDYWILIMIVVMAPLFIAIYFLMVESENPSYDILLVNNDLGTIHLDQQVNLGDSLQYYGKLASGFSGISVKQPKIDLTREEAIEWLRDTTA